MDKVMLTLLDSLTKHQIDLIARELRNGVRIMPSGVRCSGLSRKDFKTLLATTMGVSETHQGLVLLCRKIDYNGSSVYTEEKFLDYILYYLKKKEAMGDLTFVPIQSPPIFSQNIFSKISPSRILPDISQHCIYTVSKDGIIATWSQSLVIQKGTIADETATTFTRPLLVSLKKSTLWVTDATLMTAANYNLLVVATASRELNFYDVSSMVYKCQAKLCRMPHVALCLTSYSESSGSSYLMYGDETGSIIVMLFHNPAESLFITGSKDILITTAPEDLQTVLFSRLADHSKFVNVTILERVHLDWVNKIVYTSRNNSIISCSSLSDRSLVIRRLDNKHRPYVFSLSKGISCFDYCYELDLLVTGSADHTVRFWDPYVTSRPTAILTHHRTPIVDVLIHREMGIVFSFSNDSTLCIWMIVDHTLLQMITIKFPFSHHRPEYDHQVLFLLSPTVLTVSNNEYIGKYDLSTRVVNEFNIDCRGNVVSHPKPLTAAVYDSLYYQVVSGCEGGEIIVWDLLNGSKLLRIKETHGDKEITCLTMDTPSRRVLTGSSNGEVKVWNHITGECMKSMRTQGSKEITGLVHHVNKEKIYAAGWNKRVTIFPDISNIHIFHLKKEKVWFDSDLHKDDITTMAVGYPWYLAAGSFDGGIVIWNVELEKAIIKLRSMPKCSHPNTDIFQSPSRRLAAYCSKANRADHRYTPIDKLIFLKSRLVSQLLNQAVLVSSEGGYGRFWSLRTCECLGSFCLTSDEEAGNSCSVLALCSDANDKLLITGDVRGFIRVFNIARYCNGRSIVAKLPNCVATWKSHETEVVSVEHISYKRKPYILSASTDCTVRLWNIDGHYIGTFGCHNWDLLDPTTFQHPRTPMDETTTISSKDSTTQVDNEAKDGQHIDSSATSEKNLDADLSTKSNVFECDVGEPDIITISEGAGATYSSTLPSSTIDSNLYQQYGERVSERMESRLTRRQKYSGIDMKSVERVRLQCSPYQALQLLNITDATIPSKIKVCNY